MVIVRPGAAYPFGRIPLRFIRVWVLVAGAPRTFGACVRLEWEFFIIKSVHNLVILILSYFSFVRWLKKA